MRNYLIISKAYRPARRIATELMKHKNVDAKIIDPRKIISTNYGENFITYNTGETQVPELIDPYNVNAFIPYCKSGVSEYLNRVLKIDTYNHYENMELASDKYRSAIRLSQYGLPVAKELLIASTNVNLMYAVEKLGGFPVILKKRKGSQGKGVFLVNDIQSMISLIDELNEKSYILQEFVNTAEAEDRPHDYRLFVVDGTVVATMKRIATTGFKSNHSIHKNSVSIKPTREMRKLAKDATKYFNLDISGVDIAYDRKKEKWVIIEVNSAPGMGIESVTGINVAKYISDHVIETSKRNQHQRLPEFLPSFKPAPFKAPDGKIVPEEMQDTAFKHYLKGKSTVSKLSSLETPSYMNDDLNQKAIELYNRRHKRENIK